MEKRNAKMARKKAYIGGKNTMNGCGIASTIEDKGKRFSYKIPCEIKTVTAYLLAILLVVIFFLDHVSFAAVYYVDPNGSNKPPFNSWKTAATQLNTVTEGYALNGGDILYVRGTINNHKRADLNNHDSGSNIHPGDGSGMPNAIEPIDVAGSVVNFSTTPSGVNISTDYVYIYNSFRGNSGAFKVIDANGQAITVDTSDLPRGMFVTEKSKDSPWTLKAAIIRPVVIKGYVESNPPIMIGANDGLHFVGSDYIYVSHLSFYNQSRAAWIISGNTSAASDFVCIDHLISSGSNHFGSMIDGNEDAGNPPEGVNLYYTIVQHSEFTNAGTAANSTGELMYLGKDLRYQGSKKSYLYNTQIMYNSFHDNYDYGDERSNPDPLDGKDNNRNTVIWGNMFYDNDAGACYGVIKMPGGSSVIANNYFKRNDSGNGTIAVIDNISSFEQYIFNNIFDSNSPSDAVIAIDYSCPNMGIYNNTFYGIKNGDIGIYLDVFGPLRGDTKIGYLYNNIFQNLGTAIQIYNASGNKINNDDNNFFYSNTKDYYNWTPQGNIYTTNPGLNDPIKGDFSLNSYSNARNKGTNLTNFFSVDFRHAQRGSSWDIGAYEYIGDDPPGPPEPPKGLSVK